LISTALPLVIPYLLISLSTWLWYALFGKYLVLDLGLRGEELGAVMTLYNLSYAASTLPSGRLSARIDARRMLSTGIIIHALGMLLIAHSRIPVVVGAACAMAGLGQGVFFTSATIYAVGRGGVRRVGTIYGFVFSSGLLGEVLGALTSGYVKEYLGARPLFVMSALTALAAIPFTLPLKDLQVGGRGSARSSSLIDLLKGNRGFRLMASGLIFHAVSYSMISPFISVHAGELGLTDAEIGLVNFAWLASTTAAAMPWSMLTDRIGGWMILIAHVLLSSASWMTYASAWNPAALTCAAIFMGLVAAMDMPARRRLLAEMGDGVEVGVLIGSLDMITMLSSIPAPALAGAVYQSSNIQVLFTVASALNLFGAPFLMRVRRARSSR